MASPPEAATTAPGSSWRVYKLEPYAGGGTLPLGRSRGRTTYGDERRGPPLQRIGLANLEPADVIFFGDRGPRSKPSQVGHMGIYLGNGWFIHSSELRRRARAARRLVRDASSRGRGGRSPRPGLDWVVTSIEG